MRSGLPTIVALLLLIVGGCGTETASEGSGTATGSGTTTQGKSGAPVPRANGAQAARRPKAKVPRGPTSPDLIVRELIQGTGPVAQSGDILVIRYVGGIYETGREIESGGGLKRPVGFLLGGGDWALGFESGLPGMRVGGRRELIFPTSPADLPPGAELGDTLVYVVDLVEITQPGA